MGVADSQPPALQAGDGGGTNADAGGEVALVVADERAGHKDGLVAVPTMRLELSLLAAWMSTSQRAQCCLVGAAHHRGRRALAHVALDLHGRSTA